MKSQSALVTVAMLSTLLNERHTDYLDLISPFALSLLSSTKGAEVDKQIIITGLREQYGFEEFPVHVLTKILEKATKAKNGYVVKENGKYYTTGSYDRQNFLSSQAKIKDSQDEVLFALQAYLQKATKYHSLSVDKARELLVSFLEKNGLSVIGNTTDLKLLPPKDYDMYHVARFVLDSYSERGSIFAALQEVVRGFFVYKAIYYFSADQKTTFESRLKGTTIYFDTRLLIEALGYNTIEGKKAANELIRLIQDAGGQVKTFAYLKDEVAGILTKYARDPRTRYSMRLEYLDINGYREADVMRLRDKLELSLNQVGISIDDHPTVLSPEKQEQYRISSLAVALQGNLGGEYRPSRTDNDVSSISAVLAARNGNHCYRIETCKALLATTNPAFTHTVDELYRTTLGAEMRLVIDDVDLTALLWLRSWDVKSTLPTDVLLSNAYAACIPSTSLMDEFAKTVERLQKESLITEEEALLLRTQSAPRNDLLSEAQNDATRVTDGLVMQIRDKYASAITNRKDVEIGELTSALEAERKKKYIAIDKAEERATLEKNKLTAILKRAAIFLSAVVLLSGAIAFVLGNKSIDANAIWKVLLVLFGLTGLFDAIKSRSGWFSRLIDYAGVRRFDSVYGAELSRIEQYFNQK